jgi:ribonuclease HII
MFEEVAFGLKEIFMDWLLENSLIPSNTVSVCGIDEAGRGPLAGDVFAAAVVLPQGINIQGLDDSKKLSAKQRDIVYPQIKERALAWGVARASVAEIDELNILEATLLAMRRALSIVEMHCSVDFLLVDGNIFRGFVLSGLAVIGGDAKCPSIAAASVLAKVDRDKYMLDMHAQYPMYGFDKHKGYGTKAHRAAIRKYGRIPEHRQSFVGGIPKGVF